MDGSFETAYAPPSVKIEERWGREDLMGGRQGPNDNYRGRRSPGKTLDAENSNPLHSLQRVSSYSSSPIFAHGVIPQEMTLLHHTSALSPKAISFLHLERHS